MQELGQKTIRQLKISKDNIELEAEALLGPDMSRFKKIHALYVANSDAYSCGRTESTVISPPTCTHSGSKSVI